MFMLLLGYLSSGVTTFRAGYCHTMRLGIWKVRLRKCLDQYGNAVLKSLRLQDEKLQFIGLPSEYVGALKRIYPASTQDNWTTKPMFGWFCEDIWHYSESFMLVVAKPTKDFDLDINRSETDISVTGLAMLGNLDRIWKRLQGATTYMLRGIHRNIRAVRADQAAIDQANELHELRYERFVADIRTVKRLLPTKCCKYVLHIAACRIPRLL
eukprot:scaffold86746_cov36-Prasinocladus_malaysianus.AAC.1